MGYGDNIMATGFARGAKARGKRMAFGDGMKIIWDHHSEEIFRNNHNIARPGDEAANDLEWKPFYRGSRLYNRQSGDKWIWNYDFKAPRGEMFFSEQELGFARVNGSGFILVEPHVQQWKLSARNKYWPLDRYQHIIKLLSKDHDVAQMIYPGASQLAGARIIKPPTFRHALASLARARLFIGPEGGMHHGAAAVGVPAIVLFGGFIPPEVTGYNDHINLVAGAPACGSLKVCDHCIKAMESITVRQVYEAAQECLTVANAS